ncbi:MAG: LysR family transcriptional regulator [Cyanobacteria bacterium]|nr:LysR family transcriptional regulator [Cyanobacteriota bacterium]
MRIEQLQSFLAVADTGSFQAAARQCCVTQSTVSRQIQSLEAQLGLSLLRRHDRAKLTLGGEVLLPHARRICQEWKAVEDDIATLRAGKQPELCVAAIHSVCAYRLPGVLQRFIQTYPQVQLRVTALGSDRSLKVLRDGLVDVAIVMDNRFLTANADMVVDFLYSEPICVLVAADHPLTQQEAVTWADLSRYPQVLFKDGYGMQRLVQERFSSQGLPLNVVLELNTLDAFRGVIRQGNCVALLPESALSEARGDDRLAVLPLAEAANERDVVLVTTRDRLELPPIAHFRDLVLEAFPNQGRPEAGGGRRTPTGQRS